MVPSEIEKCVEQLCHRGCGEVRRIIAALENAEPVEGTESLTDAQKAEVLEELRVIMAPYGDSCPADNGEF